MEVDFTKMHGLGNDFIVISELDSAAVDEADKPAFARDFCRRNISVGADGVLFLQPSDGCDLRMRMFNPDGSEAENCVNGLRCVAFKYHLLTGKADMCVETRGGSVDVNIRVEPAGGKGGGTAIAELEMKGKREFGGKAELELETGNLQYVHVNVGNPHAVIFLDEDVSGFPVPEIGKSVEMHEKFAPARTNAEFINVKGRTALKMRVWERGAGETLSCGTGSVASVIAACELGLCERGEWVRVEQPGGALEIKYGDRLFLRGPAEISFEGRLRLGK
ncbi:MAG: diaminopimelate epimerase [Candidatus Aenigmarchaeota archaeon]|nr:diaminopimelate epimerase [Candidatus Aenigmarchaeota archaeon]